MSFLDPVKASEVKDATSFYNWANATYGAPHPTSKDFATLNRKARELFANEPGTDWQTLVQVVKWCAARKKRCARIWSYVDQYRNAWADHAFDAPVVGGSIEDRISKILDVETDPLWRSRLMKSAGEHRETVLEEWMTHRGDMLDG